MNEALLQEAIPKTATDIISRKNIDGTVSVLRIDNDQYFFNITGLAVELWLLINGRLTVQEIEEKMKKRHKELPPGRFHKDVLFFIKSLKKEKLISLKG